MERTRRRWLILLAALAATLFASFYKGDERLAAGERGAQRTQVAFAPERAREPAPRRETLSADLIPERIEPRVLDTTAEDPFTVRSWAPPPPPPPPPPKIVALPPKPPVYIPPPVPSAPVAPALPFKYLGRLEDGGVATLFLALGEKNLVVKPGETLEGSYRLDSVRGATATFTYLPMNQQQTLQLGQIY